MKEVLVITGVFDMARRRLPEYADNEPLTPELARRIITACGFSEGYVSDVNGCIHVKEEA